MNKFPIPVLFGLIALAASPARAEIEIFKIEPTVKPAYSPMMLADGTTEGALSLAVDISSEGKLTDYLVLGYSHPALVGPCIEALKEWKITPARLDGVPIDVQAELTINFRAEGVVVSISGPADLDAHLRRIFGYRMVRKSRSANELDRVPARLNTVMPQYAKAAEKDGVRGRVLVHFYIDETGTVRMPVVEASPHPYLSVAALEAVRAWKFEPPMSHGQPVLIAAQENFDFSR